MNDDYGSEHTLDGRYYPLEAHFVHYSCDYGDIDSALTAYSSGDLVQYDDDNVLAVVGVLFEIGTENPAITSILTSVNDQSIEKFDIEDLIPENEEFIGYKGSLTTPPCYETVRWHVMTNTVAISQQQLEEFRGIETDSSHSIAPNYRSIQPLNDRILYQCEDDIDNDSEDD